MKHPIIGVALCGVAILIQPTPVRAHGFEGDRFFPPTITTEDPFATDELSVSAQTFNSPAGEDGPKTREFDLGVEFDKEIFPKFALGISGIYINLEPSKHTPDGSAPPPSQSGFDNISLSAKYQLWEIPQHEFILSLGGEVDLGGTGSNGMVEAYNVWTPTLYYGKGFGDLPDAMKYLKPIALTGTIGYEIPQRSRESNVLAWNFAIEYSLPYLQQHVEDIGLPKPFGNIIPLVEFNLATPTNRDGGWTTGTINPGLLWEFDTVQIGAEALIPINSQTGPDVGCTISVQIYIDDLFPRQFGHPLFGDKK